MGHKLDKTPGSRLEGLTLLVHDLKIDTVGSLGGHAAHLPGRGVADTNLGLAYRGRLLVGRDGMSDQTTDLELASSLYQRIGGVND